MSGNRCKGVVFHGFKDVVRSERGEAAWEQTLEHVDDELATSMRTGALIQSGWYPIAWYCALHAAAQEATGGGKDLARLVGRVSTQRDLTSGLYRVMMRVLSPQFILTAAGRLFNKYYEVGSMIVEDARKGGARAIWSDCAGFDQNVWEDVFGGCEGGLLVCGAKDLQLRIVSGGHNGDRNAVIEATWG